MPTTQPVPPDHDFTPCLGCTTIDRTTRASHTVDGLPTCAEHEQSTYLVVGQHGPDTDAARALFVDQDRARRAFGLAPTALPIGCRVVHVSYEWAYRLPGGMGEVIDRHGPWPDGTYEYLVRHAPDPSRAPGPDNLETSEHWWASYATRPAHPYQDKESTRCVPQT